MTKGHNRQDEKKPNRQQGAQTVSEKQQRKVSEHKGRHSDEDQSMKKSGDKKGFNAV